MGLSLGIGLGISHNNRIATTPITVVSVVQSGSNLTWTFSAAVTLTGANVPQLENDFDGGSHRHHRTWHSQPESTFRRAARPRESPINLFPDSLIGKIEIALVLLGFAVFLAALSCRFGLRYWLSSLHFAAP